MGLVSSQPSDRAKRVAVPDKCPTAEPSNAALLEALTRSILSF
jgi:hypothetical protein